MPKILSRSKHEEFESNLALQIRNQKERRVENARKEEQKVEEKGKQWNFAGLRKFHNLRIQCCEIASCHSHCSPFYHCSSLTSCYPFLHFVPFLLFFQICPLYLQNFAGCKFSQCCKIASCHCHCSPFLHYSSLTSYFSFLHFVRFLLFVQICPL